MCNPPKLSDSSKDEELDRSDVAAAAMFISRFDPVPNVNSTDYVTVSSPSNCSGYYPDEAECSDSTVNGQI